MTPYDYPTSPLVRRHAPRGYADYANYGPWIRDEFVFRCVFCLVREQWVRATREFNLDHFLPVALHPERETEYENLLYACATCNNIKRDRTVPDPTLHLLVDSITVDEDGTITGHTPEAVRLIRVLDLDSPGHTRYRDVMISNVRLAAKYDPKTYRQMMGYPDDLPDLSTLRPPGKNEKPDGIEQSHFRRRERSELPETY